MLRIRDVYPGSEFSTSRMRIKDLRYFHPKKWFLAKLSEIWSGLFIPDPGSGFLTHPGSRIQGSKRHRIPDPQHWLWVRIQIGTVDPNACLDFRSGIWIRIRESQNGGPQKRKKGYFMFSRVRCSSWYVTVKLETSILLEPGNPSRKSWQNYVAFYSGSGS